MNGVLQVVDSVCIILVHLVTSGEESSSKRRRVQFEPPLAPARDITFSVVSTDEEAACTPVLPCTPQHAVRLGEVVASELESRTVEPFVVREFSFNLRWPYCWVRFVVEILSGGLSVMVLG